MSLLRVANDTAWSLFGRPSWPALRDQTQRQLLSRDSRIDPCPPHPRKGNKNAQTDFSPSPPLSLPHVWHLPRRRPPPRQRPPRPPRRPRLKLPSRPRLLPPRRRPRRPARTSLPRPTSRPMRRRASPRPKARPRARPRARPTPVPVQPRVPLRQKRQAVIRQTMGGVIRPLFFLKRQPASG